MVLPKLRGGFFEPSYVYMKNFPVAKFDKKTDNQLTQMVDKILDPKKRNSTEDVNKLKKAIDQKVFELYGLTEEEVEIVERSNN